MLFGPRGAYGGCWCMFWRLPRAQFNQQKGEGNKAAFQKLARSKTPLGILAYAAEQPVAWCAVAPRKAYSALERSRILKSIDDTPVWSITCLFVSKPFRRQGITPRLLKAAVTCAMENGAQAVEGYPVEPKKNSMPDPFAWTGIASAFRKAGFKEKLRRCVIPRKKAASLFSRRAEERRRSACIHCAIRTSLSSPCRSGLFLP